MGILDALSSAGGVIGKYFSDRFTSVGHAYRDAWTKTVPQSSLGAWSASLTMAQSWQPDRDSFGKGLRMWLDSAVGVGGGVLQGTLGGIFEGPGLHEATWAMDKAYRYAVARPIAWEWSTAGNALMAREEAKKRGEDPMSAYLGAIFDKDVWVGDRGMWSDQIGEVTPGQALVWAVGGGLVGQLNPTNTEDPTWLRSHDPRTPEGQAKFNSDNSEFLLKYASGTLDLLTNVAADPSSATSLAAKAGKAKYFDHLATSKYVAEGGHEAEISSKAYQKFFEVAKTAATPEELRSKTTLANAPFGGSVATVLWSAAKNPDEAIFRDVYIVARGMDGLYKGKVGAWERLQNATPRFASDMARIFANWNIGEDALLLGRNAVATGAVRSLVLNDTDAFVAAVASREGLLGSLPGKLMGTAQPKASLASAMRAGVHTWMMDVAPVKIGRPAAKLIQAFMPSQGWTPFIDAEDPTALSLRQFKANLERGGMPADQVQEWVSQWGAKGSREGRNEVFERAEAEAVKGIARRLGISEKFVNEALATISRYRSGTRQIIRQQRVYLTERAARQAARNVAAGRPSEAKALRDLNKDLTAAEKRGEFGTNKVAMPGVDGELNLVDLPDTGEMPSQAPDMGKPLLTTHTERIIPTLDLRSLEAQLKWYMKAHPVKMIEDPETGQLRLPLNDEEREAAKVQTGPLVSKVARTHSAWDALITTADYANMLWKASALLRPAQMPRNLADDVLRRMLVLGRAHVIMGAMTGTKRVFQNAGRRGVLRHEAKGEKRARSGASRSRTAVIDSDASESYFRWDVPLNAGKSKKKIKIPRFGKIDQDYGSVPAAWLAGAISLNDFIYTLKYAAGHSDGDIRDLVPPEIKDALHSYDQRIQSVSEDKLTAKNEKLPKTEIWHERALKRRVLEYYWQQNFGEAPTRFLDDFRMRGLSDKGGRVVEELDDSAVGRAMNQEYDDWVAAGKPRGNGPLPRQKKKFTQIKDPLDPRVSDRDYRVTWLAQLIAEHTRTRKRRNYEEGSADPYRPGQIVVNPFTGEMPKAFNGLEDFNILRHKTIDIVRQNKDITGSQDLPLLMDDKYKYDSPSNTMLDFIVDNLDDFMRPDTTMSMSVTPDGNIRIGVARVKPEAAHKGAVSSTASAAYRLKNFHVDGILDAGHTDIEVRTKAAISEGGKYDHGGGTLRMQAGFGGEKGQAAQHRLSSREGAGSQTLLMSDVNPTRILDQMGGWGISHPSERGYDQSWERAVNAQLSGDPVARQFLEGKTDSEVLTWLESTREGTKYLHRMHYFGTNYVDHIRQIEGLVQIYVPLQNSDAGRALRQAVLDKSATRDHLDAVEPDRTKQPEVHGASLQYAMGRGSVFKSIAKAIDTAQKYLSDLPVDKASRFPFFAESYRRHLTDLVATADSHAVHVGKEIPWTLIQNLEHQARERALYDTKYHLYDVAQLNDVARFTRFVVPFSSAIMDSYFKYGRIIKNNPAVVLQGAYYWEMFERNEQVQDENGYVLRKTHGAGGESETWYSVDPKTGDMTKVDADKIGSQRYVTFRFPSDLAKAGKAAPGLVYADKAIKSLYGVPVVPVTSINKKSFNVFIDLPATGPLVALPANEFALDHPEFGDNEIISKFVLPFGPSTSRGKVFLPATVRTAWDIFFGEDGLKAEGQAKAIFQAELIAFQRGEREAPPSMTEVRSKAGMMKGVRFATSFLSPLAMQQNSPYQPYLDAYRQLAAVDPEGADEAFMARYGDEFYAVAMTVTRNNAGIRATLSSDASFKRHADLIAAYPDMAGLIVGSDGSGEFSKSVYEAQKEQIMRPGSDERVREVMSLDESVAEMEKRRIWSEYSKMQDAIHADMADKGLTSLRGRRAADLVKVRDAFIAQNKYWLDPASGQQVISPWYNDFTSTDHALMDKRVEAMWSIVQDPDLQKRDDIRGLIDYLTLRERTQQTMARRGLKTLGSQQAETLAEEWRSSAFALREANPAFGNIWNRWLSRDDELDLGVA